MNRTRTVPSSPAYTRANFRNLAILLCILTAARLIGLYFSSVDLYFDESQYWAWSRELAFGYYSKPPLLAWTIAAAEAVCGSGEACIRAPSAFFHLATALLIYRAARDLYSEETGFFAALTYALAPGIVFSTRIISTDVPLLFFWAMALLAFLELRRDGRFWWAFVLGIALGGGLLAKYAMIYFVLCTAIAAIFDSRTRELLRTPAPWIALAIAAVLIAPNILWNIENHFSTFRHTGDNVRGSGFQLNPLRGLEFIATQFGVFGPVSFAAIFGAAFYALRKTRNDNDSLLLCFVLPILALVVSTAFISRAHPNWAATAYVAGSILVAAWLLRIGAKRWAIAGIAFGLLVQVSLLASDAFANRIQVPFLTNGDVYRQTLGWKDLGEKAARISSRLDVRTVAAEHRRDIASLIYYLRNEPARVYAWPKDGVPGDHFELTRPLPSFTPGPLLLITDCPSRARLETQFATVVPAGEIVDPTGPKTVRVHYAFRLSEPRGPIKQLAACAP